MQIAGKLALVTGGNAGIGEQIALQLVAKGAKVIIVARDRPRAETLVARAPAKLVFMQADLTLPGEQDRIIEETVTRWPDLAILVNNAGVQVNLPPVGIGDDGRLADFRSEIALNLTAPIALSLGLMPLLARQGSAAIVNISSGLAIAPKRSAPVYCAGKAGLRTFSRALRYRCEDAAPSIRVVDVIMAFVDTGMTRGRGGNKMPAEDAARSVVRGILDGQDEVWVGRTKVLRVVDRLAPAIAARLLRNG